jgi:hypothetical protein
MKSCDTCVDFVRIKCWVGRVGICDYEDGSLGKIRKQCPNQKPKTLLETFLSEE